MPSLPLAFVTTFTPTTWTRPPYLWRADHEREYDLLHIDELRVVRHERELHGQAADLDLDHGGRPTLLAFVSHNMLLFGGPLYSMWLLHITSLSDVATSF